MEIIKNKRILALVGIICLLLGTFLPYFTFSFLEYEESISLWGYWEGKIVLILTLANALFIFKDYIEKYVPQLFNNWIGSLVQKANNPKFSLVPTILVAGFTLYLLNKLDINSEFFKYGLGFWSLWVGVIALVGHAIFYKQPVQQVVQSQTYQQTQSYNQSQQYSQPQQSVQQAQFTQQQSVQPQQIMDYQQVQSVPVEQPTNVSNKKYCPQCGTQLEATDTVCFMCGRNF